MKSNFALVKYLRKLSPLLDRLVDKALKENICILDTQELFRLTSRRFLLPKWDKYTILGAGHFPQIGLPRIIVVLLPEIKLITEKALGTVEIGFAHEIAHNLTWKNRPGCASHSSFPIPLFIPCSYFELLAYYLAFQMMDKFKKELPDSKPPFFHGKRVTYLKILHHYGFPRHYIKLCKNCDGIKSNKLTKCPREKEIKRLAKAIEKCKI